jgi:hypothetical protein
MEQNRRDCTVRDVAARWRIKVVVDVSEEVLEFIK